MCFSNDDKRGMFNVELNKISLDTIWAALCHAMGINPPEKSTEKNDVLSAYIDEKLKGEKAQYPCGFCDVPRLS